MLRRNCTHQEYDRKELAASYPPAGSSKLIRSAQCDQVIRPGGFKLFHRAFSCSDFRIRSSVRRCEIGAPFGSPHGRILKRNRGEYPCTRRYCSCHPPWAGTSSPFRGRSCPPAIMRPAVLASPHPRLAATRAAPRLLSATVSTPDMGPSPAAIAVLRPVLRPVLPRAHRPPPWRRPVVIRVLPAVSARACSTRFGPAVIITASRIAAPIPVQRRAPPPVPSRAPCQPLRRL